MVYTDLVDTYFEISTGKQLVPNSKIPDVHWKEINKITVNDPTDQFKQLKEWDKQDREFVRNVHLYYLVPNWREVVE